MWTFWGRHHKLLNYNNGSTLEKTKLVKAEVYYEQVRTYDIEVDYTNTFFVNGILTHNSARTVYGVGGVLKGTAIATGNGSSLRGQTNSAYNYTQTRYEYDKICGVVGLSLAAGSPNTKHQSVGVFASASMGGGNGARAYGFATPNDVAFGGSLYMASGTAAKPAISFAPDSDTGIYRSATNGIGFTAGGTHQLTIGASAISVSTGINPSTSATYDLGSTTYRWRNLYTTDLQLSNMDRDEGNKVDGTRGDWTLQEGEEDLFVINNISGKKYKIALIPTEEET